VRLVFTPRFADNRARVRLSSLEPEVAVVTGSFPSLGMSAHDSESERHRRAALKARAFRDWQRLSVLFLAGVITFALTFALVVVFALGVLPSTLPSVLWLAAIAGGFLATWIYGMILSALLGSYIWLAVIAFPPTALPGAIIFAWLRRQELEPIAFAED
jgi:hypothetical protein